MPFLTGNRNLICPKDLCNLCLCMILHIAQRNQTYFPFIKLIHQAVTLHGEGRYAEALDYWQQALEIDSNYALAHQGVAKVMGKQERWEDALASYYLADDKEGYSEAFAEYRHETFRQHFVPIVLGIAVGAVLLVKLLGFLKKKADQWADDVQMGRGL